MESNKNLTTDIKSWVELFWNKSIEPSLLNFIKIDNLSKSFDPEWNTNGKLLTAAKHLQSWVNEQNVKGLKAEVLKHPDRSPLLFVEIAPSSPEIKETVLFYGHFDKQPYGSGWDEGIHPTIPVIKDGKMYGRGGADDGYSTYGSIAAIKACQDMKIPHPRCILTIEGDEESGSSHYEPYFNDLKEKIGNVSLVFCLDSGALDYDRLWVTNSLRGAMMGVINVAILKEGVHSGDGSGVISESFRIVRQLLDRLEDVKTGEVHSAFHVDIPPERYEEVFNLVKAIGKKELLSKYPILDGVKPADENPINFWLGRTWKPTLCITGIDGIPPTEKGGNVLRPYTNVKVSIRLPPTLPADKAVESLKKIITENPPYGAHVSVEKAFAMQGWNANQPQKYFTDILSTCSLKFFGNPVGYQGEGGSIPLINLYQNTWPKAQIIVTGVLGPGTNAHGPNEFLPINYTKSVISSMAYVLAEATPKLGEN